MVFLLVLLLHVLTSYHKQDPVVCCSFAKLFIVKRCSVLEDTEPSQHLPFPCIMCQRHARFHDEEEGGATVYASHRRLCFGRVWRFSFDPKAAKVLLLLLLVKLLKAPGQNNVMCASVPFILDDLRIDDFAFARAFAIGTALAAMVQPKLGALVDFSLRFSFRLKLCDCCCRLLFLTRRVQCDMLEKFDCRQVWILLVRGGAKSLLCATISHEARPLS